MTSPADNHVAARRLWLGVGAGFLLLSLAWTTFIIVAHRAHVQSVPLAKEGGRP